ncbi:hypothetical protein [Hoeflea sp.]
MTTKISDHNKGDGAALTKKEIQEHKGSRTTIRRIMHLKKYTQV